jgi:sterol desaturase/sphingolipid hydroxylase (fatty acid hydroxylase superfamily)
MSTLDLWITEVIPTLVFSLITGQWWISVFYYVWAAFVQEIIEHNPKVDLYPFLTSGKWHLIHHHNTSVNYGLFIPTWDILFGTFKSHKASV